MPPNFDLARSQWTLPLKHLEWNTRVHWIVQSVALGRSRSVVFFFPFSFALSGFLFLEALFGIGTLINKNAFEGGTLIIFQRGQLLEGLQGAKMNHYSK